MEIEGIDALQWTSGDAGENDRLVKITWDKGLQSYHFANIFHEILGNLLLLFFILWLMIVDPGIIIPELWLSEERHLHSIRSHKSADYSSRNTCLHIHP